MSEKYLMHFGNKNSGRYPRGSGERPHQHDGLQKRKDKYIGRLSNHVNYSNSYIDNYNKAIKTKNPVEKSLRTLSTRGDFFNLSKKEIVEATKYHLDKDKEYVNQLMKRKEIFSKSIKDIQKANKKREVKKIYNKAWRDSKSPYRPMVYMMPNGKWVYRRTGGFDEINKKYNKS